ncbi:MAG: NAD(P)H-dependent oxidoreductase [Candidatus Bathyarchaeia archaeon]|jgi:multimeric flavodoxin WrbA
MNAVIFNGAKEGDLTIKAIEKTIVHQLTKAGWEIEPIELCTVQIAACLGCFGCWVKTPGTCVINDDGRETTRKAIQSDLMVWLTPVTFGGYSSELKKALDRTIPILLPYFESYHGQIHHEMRYKKYPKLLVIGVQEPGVDYEETFIALAERNMLNLRPPASAASVFKRDKNPETIPVYVEEQLRKVEVIS